MPVPKQTATITPLFAAFQLLFALVDMRMCKYCKKAFVASRKGNEFCSQKCKNQFNVYKSREKKKGNKRDD